MNNLHKKHTKQRLLDRACQLFFYVTFLLFASWQPLLADNSSFYDSSLLLLPEQELEQVKTYYHEQLENLQQAVVPRPIHFVFAGNYHSHGRLTVSGVLFTFQDRHARQVDFVYSGNGFQPLLMSRNRYGVWYYVLVAEEHAISSQQQKIRYKFAADGTFYADPTHEAYEEDAANGLISYYYLSKQEQKLQTGVIALPEHVGYGRRYVFRLYRPEARSVSLVGSFNQWNSQLDVMKKTEEGHFELTKTLSPGEYSFVFKVDGKIEHINFTGKFHHHPTYGNVSYLQVRE